MPPRPLKPAEIAVWRYVAGSVRPLAGKSLPPIEAGATPPSVRANQSLVRASAASAASPALPRTDGRALPKPGKPAPAANTLDASWDRRLTKGMVAPDRTIDLHGHTLSSAHAELDRALGCALRTGARIVLLITGKPGRDNPRLPPTSRGIIRASIADWLAASGHARQIAAIRTAHPRHGGAGALYLILKRERGQ